MLSGNSRGNKKAYAFVGGMYNIAYLVGFARNIRRGNNGGFELQQTNNLNMMLPISTSNTCRVPNDLCEGEAIKVVAHISGKRAENGIDRTCVIEAIDFERPNLLEMPPSLAWSQFVPPGAPTDGFNPFKSGDARDPSDADLNEAGVGEVEKERIQLGKNANLVYLAGFVDSFSFLVDENGRTQHDCLHILLRQHDDQGRAIPVRHYGKYATPYKKTVSEAKKSIAQIGFPILVEGQIKTKVKPLAPAKEGEVTPVERLLYVHCPHPLVATPKDITTRPKWMTELLVRAQAQRRELSGESQPAARVAAVEDL